MSHSQDSYEQALGILSRALVFGIDPSLDGIRALAEKLGNPQKGFVSLQVAGTNGKSSVSRMLAALLREEGMHVGLYTSPELVEYPERFEIDGEVISHAKFAEIVHVAAEAADDLSPMTVTEFELLTAAALYLFGQEQIDFAVFEVGMGGKWDATSIVDSAVATITGIGLDHKGILGDTELEIAGEKAAIIKPASSVVLGPGTAATQEVFLQRAEECATHPRVVFEKGSDLFPSVPAELSVTYSVKKTAPALVMDVEGCHARYEDVTMVAPPYQIPNIATAIAAAESALGRALNPEAVRRVFAKVVIPGRFETLRSDPLLIIDAAHNPQGASVLAEAIANRFTGVEKPTLLLAVLKDKDAAGIIKALKDAVAKIVVTKTESPRAMSTEDLAGLVYALTGTHPKTFETPAEALVYLTQGDRSPAVVASGSITLAGAIKGLFLNTSA
ncbi:MAG: bifunctional folylpolyglutamate synthase/dihydrofolate synthase [Actinobacteria bacterium]|nr:bifunctional folylpolyglutamate synthase/dihydrofolate synthase [Actinomycetota bacterium]